MIRNRMSQLLKRLTGGRAQSGQSVIILAIAFVALTSFVGIVTDTSLMFVRYAQLSRAVDSASIAAATQYRQGTDFATISLSARQFLEFHGLDPVRVLVDTCLSVDYDFTDELCEGNNRFRKLVRVTAQIDSPTVFLRLIGWNDFTLQASAIAETAVLDVVMLLDVSESMLNQTTYDEWADIGRGIVYVPPRVTDLAAASGTFIVDFWQQDLLGTPQVNVNNRLAYDTDYSFGGSNAPSASSTQYPVQAFTMPGAAPGQTAPREECRVRFFPGSIGMDIPPYLRTLYGALWTGGNRWDGFVPTHDFYGCCNDPGGNGEFSDLICQPFLDARNATQAFIERIDFARGDRVAFITFDRNAFIINPFGQESRDAGFDHMISSSAVANYVVNSLLGVRAGPDFYDYVVGAGTGATSGWGDLILLEDEYPARGTCPFRNATLPYPFSRYLYKPGDFRPVITASMFDNAGIQPGFNPNVLQHPGWATAGVNANHNYEMWASCRGTNMGAGLRESNNALINNTSPRRSGAVWVIVMLSDGAAGASDPVHRTSRRLADGTLAPLLAANPYAPNAYSGGGTTYYGIGGDYGAYGICPTGTPNQLSELTDVTEDPALFPFCSDEMPWTRHYCPGFTPNNTEYEVDLDDCHPFYDVDDYARDWADAIGLLPPGDQSGEVQLPTIFTIAFGLSFGPDNHCDPNSREYYACMCGQYVEACLGEEMLRYIADVGDNNRIDTHYWKDWLDTPGEILGYLINDPNGYGALGPCETDRAVPVNGVYSDPDDLYKPAPPGTSCGQYYWAPTGDELELVFAEIATRMFTRLSR